MLLLCVFIFLSATLHCRYRFMSKIWEKHIHIVHLRSTVRKLCAISIVCAIVFLCNRSCGFLWLRLEMYEQFVPQCDSYLLTSLTVYILFCFLHHRDHISNWCIVVFVSCVSSTTRRGWWVSTRTWRTWQRTSWAWHPSTTCAPTTRRL